MARKSPFEHLRDFALTLPEAWEDHPWEHTVVKVRKKIFVFVDAHGRGGVRLTVKLPESEASALDLPGAESTGYGLGKHGWVSLNCEAGEMPAMDLLEGYVLESYRAVAPKTLIKQLGA
ncbi:MAG: MmcQ/YjbR family DNA-binding protein [Planctomycetota bacterium]